MIHLKHVQMTQNGLDGRLDANGSGKKLLRALTGFVLPIKQIRMA